MEEQFIRDVVSYGCSLVSEIDKLRFNELGQEQKYVFTVRVEQYVVLLGYVYLLLIPTVPNISTLISNLTNNIVAFFGHALEQTYPANETETYQCPFEPGVDGEGAVGRPRYCVGYEQISGLRKMGFTWRAISAILNVSERTLRRRRQEFGMPSFRNEFADLSNEEIDQIVAEILTKSPNSGERMVTGSIRSRGLKISREKLRDSINRVDPVSRALRRSTCIIRRRYNVKGPNCLW